MIHNASNMRYAYLDYNDITVFIGHGLAIDVPQQPISKVIERQRMLANYCNGLAIDDVFTNGFILNNFIDVSQWNGKDLLAHHDHKGRYDRQC